MTTMMPRRATPLPTRDWWTPPPVYREDFVHIRPPGPGRPARRAPKVRLHAAAGDRTARQVLDQLLVVLGVSREAFEAPGRIAATREARRTAYAILRALGLSWPAVAACGVKTRNHSSVLCAVKGWADDPTTREPTRRVCRAVQLGSEFDSALDLVRGQCQRMTSRSRRSLPD